MVASYKFVQKIYSLNEKIKNINNQEKTGYSIELSKFVNQYLSKIERNLSNFHYNVIIANIHEAYGFLNQITTKNQNFLNLVEDYSKFLISITPVVPHLASECLSQFNIKNYSWPNIDSKLLIEENVKIVVQINGRKRGIINSKKDISTRAC